MVGLQNSVENSAEMLLGEQENVGWIDFVP